MGIEGRSSNRIVKPPGGDHTDIFGSSHEKMEVTTSRYAKQSQKTSISECFAYGTPPQAARKQECTIKESNETSKTVASENGLKNGNGTPTEDENIKPPVTVAVTVPAVAQRVRVPPGGFSSGLW